MNYPMDYPKFKDFNEQLKTLAEYARLKYEYGTDKNVIEELVNEIEMNFKVLGDRLKDLPEDADLAAKESDSLESIRILRPDGPRSFWKTFDRERYMDKLKGALLGRFAGCTLGAPVEFWSVVDMKDWADYIGDVFPPIDYWASISDPNHLRYGISKKEMYTRKELDGVPADDDITYTILGLLIMEEYGPNFTIDDVGEAWKKYLPYACTAEHIALENLKAGIPAMQVALLNNPYVQWIGADIRSDPWGYLAPGMPEKAAEYAYRDAYISHRRNGIYGEMYFSAAISAAFEINNVIEALEIALTEIPRDCLLAKDIRWAINEGSGIKNYIEARKAVDERFGDMSKVHTNINACLTIFGLMIGGDDFTKVIGETVAMGYDNDCTAATAGSIFGAANGISSIPEHWYKNFNNKVLTYMNGQSELKIDDILNRFAQQAEKLF